ncbi:MAG: F0F1 ATP synthase subunit delta [Pseudomonadota bacterium]
MAASSASTVTEAARRYASALFDLAKDKAALEAVREDFSAFAKLVRESAELKRLIESPAFTREDKTAALGDVAKKAGIHQLLANFVGVMATNGRARDLLSAQTAFDALYAKQRGVKRAVARTAKPMTDTQRANVEALLAKTAGGGVELTEEVDPALIGGLQLRIGSKLIDASIATKLDRMNTAMKGA